MSREQQIKYYGLDFVVAKEEEWLKRGYIINYKTGLLESIK